jgi:hydrogenase maturation protein HypF
MGKGNRAYLSQHIGDLKNNESMEFYEETFGRFKKIFRTEPVFAVTDLHPDYLSTRFAMTLNLETRSVQHHHAHIASCMAENEVHEPVIGLAFDGTGYGTDGHTWGSEFLVCDYAGFTRMAHFSYMPMPGGDHAAEEPWRMGLSLLFQTFGDSLLSLDLPFLEQAGRQKAAAVVQALTKNINCPLSSGAGRLFDAIAAITGTCVHALFHAEAPMRLESILDRSEKGRYDFTPEDLSFVPAIQQICRDMESGVPVSSISARFHNTIVEASVVTVQRISRETGITRVALSGGTFQNKYLFETLVTKLQSADFAVLTHSRVPCNDGGLALGQLAVGAWSRR